jgi:2-keto-4-pentenoate hydratase
MLTDAADQAANILRQHFRSSTRLAQLPVDCRPANRADGYRIQHRGVALTGQAVVGWKIAATSTLGQAHIGVDGPLAGSLLADRVLDNRAVVSLAGNHMRVAEAEFGFRFDRALPPREAPYTRDEVLDAVSALHPTVEIPDSRYEDFCAVGTSQLIADNACACWLVVGAAANADWRALDLAGHVVQTTLNGGPAEIGFGRNVLGSPLNALTWIANELRSFGPGLRAGDLVTTGTCIVPVAIRPGDKFHADFGVLGKVTVSFGSG